MPISTNTRGGSGAATYPSLKFPEVGTKAVIRLCHAVVVDKYVYNSNPPVVDKKPDGSPRQQVKLTGVLQTAGQKSVKLDDGSYGYEPVAPGEVVTYYISGHNRFTEDEHRQSWGQATDAYGKEPYIGDLIQMRRDADEPGMGAQPKRCMWFNVVAQDPATDNADIAAAEALYHEIEETPQAATGAPAPQQAAPAAATVPAAAPGLNEEEPF